MSSAEDGPAVLPGLDEDSGFAPLFGRVRLRTLIVLRWLAVAGQTGSILLVHYGLGFDLPLAACLLAVAASAALNLILPLVAHTQRFAKDWEAFAQLAFDVGQLVVLLGLTGGLTNPFAVMLVAPLITAVAALPTRWWLPLFVLAAAGTAAIGLWRLPLPWGGERPPLDLPPLYQLAIWVALTIAIAFTAVYAWRVGGEAKRMGAALAATQSVLAREQRLSALGALSAAAAHELGTPLATIQLTAKEMARALDDPELKEDADLLVSQAERCRDILKRLSRNAEAGDRVHERMALDDALDEAVAPLKGLGPPIRIALDPPDPGAEPPLIKRRAELLYALGNFVENAVDFARSEVIVTGGWDEQALTVTIADDGPGFPPDVLSKLGEPYITTRRAEPGAGGLGLGVFIAITLTERVGGTVSFANAPEGGARVTMSVPRAGLRPSPIAGPNA